MTCFNRTFMELKYHWIYKHKQKVLRSFNRTFMELKYQRISVKLHKDLVLIVPLWN